MNRLSDKFGKKGFTLTELIVVLVIIGILAAIGIPTAAHFIRQAEYRKNEENAKTAYLAAESTLTWYRSSGEWKDFREQVKTKGILNDTFPEGDKREGRIYAVSVNLWDGGESASKDLALKLLDGGVYSRDFYNAEIVIEVDVESGQVYSAFYGAQSKSLTYQEDAAARQCISASGDWREPEVRRKAALGYYSVEDVANVVELKKVRLKVTTINLINSETLSLNWTSNSRNDNLDVVYQITFYRKDAAGDQKLFTTEVELGELRGQLKTADGEDKIPTKTGMVRLELKDPAKAPDAEGASFGEWAFPLTYQQTEGRSGRFSLVLDGMMTAELAEAVKGSGENLKALQNACTSITRLGEGIAALGDLKSPQDIYAEIQAQPAYREIMGENGDSIAMNVTEYKMGASVRSNTENTLFAEADKKDSGLEAEITRFRHLSNIRYYAQSQPAVFILPDKNLDWTSAGVGMYGITREETGEDGGIPGYGIVKWQNAVTGGQILDFPSIPMLSEHHKLEGKKGTAARISNLHLGVGSMPDDGQIRKLYKENGSGKITHYLGLFCETEGQIRNLTFMDPVLRLAGGEESDDKADDREGTKETVLPTAAENFGALYGVGILSGRNQGSLEHIAVKVTYQARQTVWVGLEDRSGETGATRKPAGIGGLVGILAGKDANGSLTKLTNTAVTLTGLTTEGAVTGRLPDPDAGAAAGGGSGSMAVSAEERACAYPYGIGGMFGYVWIGGGNTGGNTDSGVQLAMCRNRGDVKGNLFTGGIAGSLKGDFDETNPNLISIKDSQNDGLVLCLVNYEEEEQKLEGRFFGGILGYGDGAQVSGCVNASQYREVYESSKRAELLKGHDVGGIIGYGNHSQLSGCSTRKDSYVFGSHYVGGIAGGLSNDLAEAITGGGAGTSGIQVTTNAGYVIGERYVGGIVGQNDGSGPEGISTVSNCINNGVAAGYDRYVGGIAGYNGTYGAIADCASYFSDYSGSVYQTIVEKWKVTGDCTGGLAGYNNGAVTFSKENPNIQVKSVSGIVVGRNYVGGVVGLNDVDGMLEVASYDLIGGQIHGVNGVGGCIGLNASEEVLKGTFAIRPAKVEGDHYVGGCIGADVVDLTATETQMNGIKTDNPLGSVTGNAFTGGVIGYHRTYKASQLTEEWSIPAAGSGSAADAFYGKSGRLLLGVYIDAAEGAAGENGVSKNGESEAGTAGGLLPVFDGDNVPGPVMASENENLLVIGDVQNITEGAQTEYNNIPVFSDLYTGGIMGYCEKNSRLHIVNSRNSGNLSRRSRAGDGKYVSLTAYLKSQEVGVKAEDLGQKDLEVSIGGGVIGANLENQIIDHCINTGTTNGFIGLGGIVGFNAGGVFNCELTRNFGNPGLDYLGGIAGLNVHAGGEKNPTDTYTDVMGYKWDNCVSGTVAGCGTAAGIRLSGHSCVGGIVGFNLSGAEMKSNKNLAHVSGAGDSVGGMAGANSGTILVSDSRNDKDAYTVSGSGGEGIGGIVGYNRSGGVVDVAGSTGTGTEIIAVNENVSVTGKEKVGGVVGVNEGKLEASAGTLVCQAKLVRATNGYAGGIIGEARIKTGGTAGDTRIAGAVNCSLEVTADRGPAGGIVAVNQEGFSLTDCTNLGNVKSDNGYAGGIAAENYGWITNCKVGEERKDKTGITVSSKGADAIGAVCAVNYGVLFGSAPEKSRNEKDVRTVILDGTARIVGGIAGINAVGGQIGILSEVGTSSPAYDMGYMPQVNLTAAALTVGGVAGQNQPEASIRNMTVKDLSFEDFSNYQYLGGVTGENQSGASVKNCLFQDGKITQKSGTAAGSCYGGVAGRNDGLLQNCEIDGVTIEVQGVYTATSTSTAAEKEVLSSHVGGIAGKNETNGEITGCLITGKKRSSITVENGMAGGVAGYNKNQITLSGDKATDTLMQKSVGSDGSVSAGVADVKALIANAKGISADENYVNWNENAELENQTYAGRNGREVSVGRSLTLLMSNNGNLGGITAYNAPSAQVSFCATGNWYLNNKSEAIGVGTGGIIGMNESGKDQEFLLNQAFVGRQLQKSDTDRFAGGIIGNQNNITKSGWTIQNCVNYGTVYCKNTHYSGGIIGQWTGTGGDIERCYNFGNLQTTCVVDWLGASAGIVAQLYHAYESNEYNITGCENYGNIYGRNGPDIANCANDSAGILGNVTAYTVDQTKNAQKFTINVTDCVNGPGVKIYSWSMASGIVGFLSCSTNPGNGTILNSTANITLHIERCRNYASVLRGRQFVAGIFGDRYGESGAQKTTIKHNFSLDYSKYATNNGIAQPYPIVSCKNANAKPDLFNQKESKISNFFLSDRKGIGGFPGEGDQLSSNPLDKDTLLRVNAGWVYSIVRDGRRYFVYIPGSGNYNISGLSISGNKVTYRSWSGNVEIGEVLFVIEDSGDVQRYGNMGAVAGRGEDFDYFHNFDTYVRKFCFDRAGFLLAPEKVVLSKTEDGKFRLEVNAPAYAGSNDVEYVAKLYRAADDGTVREIPVSRMTSPSENIAADTDVFRFTSETCTFDLSDAEKEKGGELFVKLYVHQKNPEMKSSEVESNRVPIGSVLPDPKLRIELIPNGNSCQYRFRLANRAAYTEDDHLRVHVKLMDGTELVLEPFASETSKQTATYSLKADSLQQLVVWVTSDSEASSAETSVPVYLPAYTPPIDVQKTAPSCTVSGTSLKDLTITVTLTSPGESVATPPIYRAELVGAEADGTVNKDDVLRTADVLTVAGGSASAVFSGFSDEEELQKFTEATNIRVRVWYAQSGLGPVYTYYMEDLLNGEAFNTRTKELLDGQEEQGMKWQDAYTHVLTDNAFSDFRWTSPKLFEWLDAPVLMNVPDGQSLTPDTDLATGHLNYTFTWDQGKNPDANTYLVTLTGVTRDEAGNESNPISIVTDQEVTGGSLTLNAEDWPYEKVTLSVTRKGYDAAGTVYIGKTSDGTYSVKKRLPRTEQPKVTNPNVNELQYEIEWSPVTPESGAGMTSGCTAYEINIRPMTSDPALPGEQIPVKVLENGVPTITEDGVYRTRIDLEKYAGQRVLISIRALAADNDPVYVHSVDGVTYEMAVPERIAAPTITAWGKNWKYQLYSPSPDDPDLKDETKSVEAFEGGGADGLKVTLTAGTGSLPPGGSSYLLKAYVFGSEEAAKAAKKALEDGTGVDMGTVVAYYPSLNGGEQQIPAGMEPEGTSQDQFGHTLAGLSAEHAGKYILFSARISSGDGKVSSPWVVQTGTNPDSFIWRLPYVKLPTPDVSSETGESKVTMRFSANPDLNRIGSPSADQPGEIKETDSPAADVSSGGSVTNPSGESRTPSDAGETGPAAGDSAEVLSIDDSAEIPEIGEGVLASQTGDSAAEPQADSGAAPQADDLPEEEEWTAENTVLTWSSVRYADAYYFTLTDEDGMDDGSERTAAFRIVEDKTENDPSASTVTVYGRNTDDPDVWVKIAPTDPDAEGTLIYDLSQAVGGFQTYGKTAEGFYAIHLSATSIRYETDLKSSLAVTLEEDGSFTYTLTMPDANTLTPPEDGAYGSEAITNGGDHPLRFTDTVRIWSDMVQNEDPSTLSEAYVKSVEHVAEFNN